MEITNNFNNITISEDIERLVLECQKLLLEFFKNNAQNFDSSKFERMKEVFSTFSVVSKSKEDIHYRGARCNHETNTIEISRDANVYSGEIDKGITKEYKIMSFIIHEYGHAFSGGANLRFRTIEEGMQISLEENVMNYYFKTRGINAEHRNIGYGSNRKSLTKTLLYVLSKDNQDINAISEYLFGDKQKFISMFFTEEYVKNNNLTIDELQSKLSNKELNIQFPNEFTDIDESSIYCDDNDIIHSLWLQNFVEEDILTDDDFKDITSKKGMKEKYKQKYGKEVVVDSDYSSVKTL